MEKLEQAMVSLNNFRLDYLKIDKDNQAEIETKLVVNILNCIDHVYEEINKILLRKLKKGE